MSIKKYLLASVFVFIALQVTNFLGHNLWLSNDYEALAALWRPDMMDKMWIYTVVGALTSFIFVYIFTKGCECRGIMEGVRYGLVIGLFISTPAAFYEYAMYAIPFMLAVKWFFLYMAQHVLCGIVTAFVYNSKGCKCCCGSSK